MGNDKSVDVSVNDLQDKLVDIQVNKIVNKSNNDIDLSFKRKPRKRKPVPMTYRLYPETIDKIDELAMKSGMYVSEFLQSILDKVLDRVDIE
jgi:hypothetical protein